jgi:hypothetical protein
LLNSGNALLAKRKARPTRQFCLLHAQVCFSRLDPGDAEVQALHCFCGGFLSGICSLCSLGAIFDLALDMAKGASSVSVCLANVPAWLLHSECDADFGIRPQDSTRIDAIAARQIQQTLQPATWPSFPGYEIETFYKPFREVGGDYFDIIELPENRVLFAVADVSGKGMPAALLAANIQALVRSIANFAVDPFAFALQINKHLSRYTPRDRFATALFIVLSRDTGELTYVNAGHNPPIVSSSGSTQFLEPTGIPLGCLPMRSIKPILLFWILVERSSYSQMD